MKAPALKKIVCIFLFVCFFAIVSSAQKIAPQDLKADFTLLRDTLQKIHPGIYRYKSKQEIDRIFDSCYASIKDSMQVTEFFALINFAIAAMEDGHSNCRMPRDVMNKYIDKEKIFPAVLLFIHSKPFIYCCKQNERLAGTELVSIDNQPMDKVMKRLFAYIPSDGNIQSRKDWEMNENFPFLYNILYGAKDSFEVKVKTTSGEIITTQLTADLYKHFICPSPFPRPSRYLTLEYKPGNVAILTVKTFLSEFVKQTGGDFKIFLDSAFDDIKEKKVKQLVIDIRNNQGGNDENGAILYTYIASKPFRYYASLESVQGKFPDSAHPNLKMQYPSANAYHGKLYILANGRSFSASAEFAAIVKTNERGVFVGEEAGGGYYGNTSGDDVFVTLPASKLSARIPMVKYTMAVKNLGSTYRGIKPDYVIYPTIKNIIEKDDEQLANTIKLVKDSDASGYRRK